MSTEEIIEAFENLRYFESTCEVEWGRVQAEADRAIETLKQVKNNDLLHSVSGCFTEQDMLMAYCNGASESTVNDLDLTIQVGTKVDAENFLKKYKKNNR